MGLSRTELFAVIRRDKRLDRELSQRVLAERYGAYRRTVRQALLPAVPPPRKKPAPRVTALDPAKPWIDAMLREDASAPRKQKHTARRIHQRLSQEYDFDLVSYFTVCDYVLARRGRSRIESERWVSQVLTDSTKYPFGMIHPSAAQLFQQRPVGCEP